jgi:hypothetical protein
MKKKKKTEDLSLHGLEPGTEEYKRVEALLIKQICDIDLGDESRFERKKEMLAKNCSVQLRIAILKDEIEVYKSRLDPKKSKIDTLYLRDAIGIIERRIIELELQKETIREETLPYR